MRLTDATCKSLWPDTVFCWPSCLGPEVEQLGLGDLAGDPLPLPFTFSALARLIARRSSPDVTVAVEAEDTLESPLHCLL